MDRLEEPLPTVLRAMAQAMKNGVHHQTVGKDGEYHNYQELLTVDREIVFSFLRKEVERLSRGRRSLREASPELVQMSGAFIYALVVCDWGREEDEVTELHFNELLYLIFTMDITDEILVTQAH